MDCYGVYRDSFFTHANKLGISFFCPRCIGIGMFLPAGIYRIDRLAAKAFVCLEIFFQTLYILVAQMSMLSVRLLSLTSYLWPAACVLSALRGTSQMRRIEALPACIQSRPFPYFWIWSSGVHSKTLSEARHRFCRRMRFSLQIPCCRMRLCMSQNGIR